MWYTEKIHAKNLIEIFESGDSCNKCPGTHDFSIFEEPKDGACEVCNDFVNIPHGDYYYCPCDYFGEEEAIKLTWIALKKKGYI